MKTFDDYIPKEYKVVKIENKYTSLWIKLHKLNNKIKLRSFIKPPPLHFLLTEFYKYQMKKKYK